MPASGATTVAPSVPVWSGSFTMSRAGACPQVSSRHFCPQGKGSWMFGAAARPLPAAVVVPVAVVVPAGLDAAEAGAAVASAAPSSAATAVADIAATVVPVAGAVSVNRVI
ncbi:hypothetical protein Sru01_28570 [Sphaerisporangium rufum]|uniref:Uncharacterized protein n=1 Tax=Sphaerisporangium rufum TaxID=1381558 RepID=A0A919R3W0_9ACTN|nr:hypothetical protein Sru01_28570 [Sphaerisporangium rufum]